MTARHHYRDPTIAEIQALVCARFGLPLIIMTDHSRVILHARPRQMAMALARSLTGKSSVVIGRHFGGRDHSTVLLAARRIEDLRQTNAGIDADVRALTHKLAKGGRMGPVRQADRA